MSAVMIKPDFCICENKGPDQLYSNCTADQHLCFCSMVSRIFQAYTYFSNICSKIQIVGSCKNPFAEAILTCTLNLCLKQKYQKFSIEIFNLLLKEFSVYCTGKFSCCTGLNFFFFSFLQMITEVAYSTLYKCVWKLRM